MENAHYRHNAGQLHGLRGQSASVDPALGGAERRGQDPLITARKTLLLFPVINVLQAPAGRPKSAKCQLAATPEPVYKFKGILFSREFKK